MSKSLAKIVIHPNLPITLVFTYPTFLPMKNLLKVRSQEEGEIVNQK
jgi:hypothetical protein